MSLKLILSFSLISRLVLMFGRFHHLQLKNKNMFVPQCGLKQP